MAEGHDEVVDPIPQVRVPHGGHVDVQGDRGRIEGLQPRDGRLELCLVESWLGAIIAMQIHHVDAHGRLREQTFPRSSLVTLRDLHVVASRGAAALRPFHSGEHHGRGALLLERHDLGGFVETVEETRGQFGPMCHFGRAGIDPRVHVGGRVDSATRPLEKAVAVARHRRLLDTLRHAGAKLRGGGPRRVVRANVTVLTALGLLVEGGIRTARHLRGQASEGGATCPCGIGPRGAEGIRVRVQLHGINECEEGMPAVVHQSHGARLERWPLLVRDGNEGLLGGIAAACATQLSRAPLVVWVLVRREL